MKDEGTGTVGQGIKVPGGAIAVAIAVVEHHDCFLIGPREVGTPLEGLWEFPGGKIQAGESPAEAAVRECREETGLAVQVVGPLGEQLQAYPHGTVRLHFFSCQLGQTAGEPREPFRWVTRSELNQFPFPAGNTRVLRRLSRNRR